MRKKGKWVYESMEIDKNSLDVGYKVEKILFRGKSKFQKILVFQTNLFGKILFLDGYTQTTEADEVNYHEMMAHLPLFSHPEPQKVLIIGGGDGGVLREALKHKTVKKAVMVEIDEKVIAVSKKYLPKLSGDAFSDKRVEIVIDDGVKYVRNASEKFDVVMVDSSDPIGPASVLYSKEFYQSVFDLLSPDGIAIYQSGTTFFQKAEIKSVREKNEKIFSHVNVSLVDVPTYFIGNIALTLASKKINPEKAIPGKIKEKYLKSRIRTKYYNPNIHFSSFSLPNYLGSAAKK